MSKWIALDIDGTLTAERYGIPEAVVRYLGELSREWRFLFVTGRPFHWGWRSLQQLDFPFLLAVQNGALLLQMPERRIVSRKYLEKSILEPMDRIAEAHGTDYAIYGGYEEEDRCYYRPNHFPKALCEYVERRAAAIHETWIAVADFQSLPFKTFPSIKAFAPLKEGAAFVQEVEEKLKLHVPLIKDPFDSTMVVMQATHPGIHKGAVIDELRRQYGASFVIAAGDDLNDIPMLEKADFKIVMETAPASMQAIADLVAPSAEKEGIIEALKQRVNHG